MKPTLIPFVFLCSFLCCGLVFAAPSEADRVAAQALFEQGRDLMKAGKYPEACPKFAESQRLDPGIGTQFNLADCYEKIGRLASAYTIFLDVAARARGAGQGQREQVARDRAEAVRPLLTRLVLVVPEAAKVTGLKVERGETVVGAAQWGLPIPVDPGAHRIRASAPGKQTWEATVEIPADSGEHTFSIEPLADQPVARQAREPESGTGPRDSGVIPASSWNTQKTVAVAVAGVGLVGVGIGSVFGLRAISKNDEAKEYCSGNECLAPGFEARNEARDAGTIATVGFGVGIAGLATGAVLYLLAPGPKAGASAAPSVTPRIGIGHAELSLSGSF